MQMGLLNDINKELTAMDVALVTLKNLREEAITYKSQKERAFFFREKVVPAMEALRAPADRLERMVDKKVWPFPTYADLMFEV